ncbi:MAG: 5,10-methylenetetrahydrofolate dehydrogenase / methenyltetrahydrofolate cyclohydrolase [Cyanobacteria bacterium RYN_339]|nr:5,10-methylenetetrahydrofolate dehydrogenase / methenyltetrahydrofolate cyclohydrolase [Cyanobacteria bacterium RYN_339]
METQLASRIDGKAIAADLRASLKDRVDALPGNARRPGLAVVQVGADPASSVYVRNKRQACETIGYASFGHELPADTSQADLLALVHQLNADPAVDGILVQLPLPTQIDPDAVIGAIDPEKDVDGFHPFNLGRLVLGQPTFASCTPAGVMVLLERSGVSLKGKHAVVVGRSAIVGKPMAALLLNAHATVTICHSRTPDLGAITRQADVLIAAVGRTGIITGDMIKPGAVVIDVGMNRDDAGKLCGDVEFASAQVVAGQITPVPGGVGPMTIAMLMANTWDSYQKRCAAAP